ncbi:hypothetical protein [Vibrio crassostreae]|uniref:hypothetical protein n=1 Tax=Vibrio crassostreae TaxID=246167 RepID=UPI001B316300|nr:hypothetical protein [Vibrio crassostreae]
MTSGNKNKEELYHRAILVLLRLAILNALKKYTFKSGVIEDASSDEAEKEERTITIWKNLLDNDSAPYELDKESFLSDVSQELSAHPKKIDAYGTHTFQLNCENGAFEASVLNTYGDEDNFDARHALVGMAFIVDRNIYLVDVFVDPESKGVTFDFAVSTEKIESKTEHYSGKRAFYHYRGLGVSIKYTNFDNTEVDLPSHRLHQGASSWGSSPRHFFQATELTLKD